MDVVWSDQLLPMCLPQVYLLTLRAQGQRMQVGAQEWNCLGYNLLAYYQLGDKHGRVTECLSCKIRE